MKHSRTAPVIGLLCVVLSTGAAQAEVTHLWADFNDKTIDEPIGMGGAEVGEPVSKDNAVTATVREGPLATPCLEIADALEGNGYVRFELLGETELTTGKVYLSADLWFESLADAFECTIMVKDEEPPSVRFAELGIEADGRIYLHYGQSSNAGTIGQVATGRLFRVIFEFDMDAGTFNVWLDGELAVSGLEHEITEAGVGSFLFGCHWDEDAEGSYYVDAVVVTDYFQAVATEEHSWGRMKAAFR